MKTLSEPFSAAILAGGQSRRMGQDKSFILLNGISLIQKVVTAIQPLNCPCCIIANTEERYLHFGLPIHPDEWPGGGSLGGIYTALVRAPAHRTLVVACDMPFLNPALLLYVCNIAPAADAVVPIAFQRPQGLHAVYSKRCIPIIHQQLQSGNFRINDLFDHLNVHYIAEEEVKKLDPDLYSFLNLNTPNDLQQVTHLPLP